MTPLGRFLVRNVIRAVGTAGHTDRPCIHDGIETVARRCARLRLDVSALTPGAHIDAGGTFALLECALSLLWCDFDALWMTATI